MMRPLLLFLAIGVLIVFVGLVGCRPAECTQMLECCEVAEDLDGTAGACGQLAEDTRDPQTCRDVVRTVGYMYEDRDEPVPEACRF